MAGMGTLMVEHNIKTGDSVMTYNVIKDFVIRIPCSQEAFFELHQKWPQGTKFTGSTLRAYLDPKMAA